MRNPSLKDSAELTSHVPDASWHHSPVGIMESSLINADEELIRTASIATLEADRSQQEVERWRLEADVQIRRLNKMRHEKELLLQEIWQLERSLKQAQNAASNEIYIDEKSLKHEGSHASTFPYNIVGDNSIVVPDTFTLASRDNITARDIELRYLISRSIATLDALQSDVAAMKQQHADLWTQEREIGEDIKRLKTTYQGQEEKKGGVAKARALQEKQEMKDLFTHATDRRSALKQTRMERVSMIAHLLEGLTLRERQVSHADGTVVRKKGFREHPMYPILLSLQEENKELHSKYIKLVQSNEEEDTALVEYLSVLLERLLMAQGNKTLLVDFSNLSTK
ncbi:hypothetical protein LSM04_008876 [Trypanosoma melophagium]|uniref:uncharacterized protein n=1 Tax=Trypanosoma melophagium TaxID=715481 RepID=UPI00351A7E11|nr:hypothetical protein LSM04_008876 [Trypanosoma melophagium]